MGASLLHARQVEIAIHRGVSRGFPSQFLQRGTPMTDPDGVLERKGPNTGHSDMIRFVSNERVTELAPVIRANLDEAKSYAAQGLKEPRGDSEPELPDD